MEGLIIGVDTGGTFTDFIYFDGKEWKVFKIPSTPKNPAEAVLKGLEIIGGKNRRIVHGTTVATNALLERKGAKTALITNKGFEDVIEIGRQNRERLYDLHYRKPEPLIPRSLRFGIKGRINYKGEILEDIDEEEILEVCEKLKREGVESVAVCFLHSYANPSHERITGEIISRKLKDIKISLSSEILREFREYERYSTTVINAYVSPKMERYLTHLEKNLKEGDTLRVMQSNGGIISVRTAGKEAVRTILSGPAGGVISATYIGKLAGFEKLITFDMGGTSTDVCLIDKKPVITTEAKIEGFPVKVPIIDIHTVGAGGGSIARVDEGGILKVGPQSAGAEPGPVCYGKGGKEITVTDANLFLGRLDADHFLGGEMKIYPELVKPYMKELARKLKSDEIEVANAILNVANSNMERALRKVSVHRGYNPEEFTLLSFGGAGGMHAVFLARLLRIPRVLVPLNPGIFSALGMVLADVIKDYSLTVMLKGSETSYEELKNMFKELEEKAISDMIEEGFKEEDIVLEHSLDMRYEGQSYEISVPFSENFTETFHKEHERIYHYRHDREIEIVNLRLKCIGSFPKPPLFEFKEKKERLNKDAVIKEIETFFEDRFFRTRVIDRNKLFWGNVIEGPAVVVEYSSTTVIPPETYAEVDKYGNIIICV